MRLLNGLLGIACFGLALATETQSILDVSKLSFAQNTSVVQSLYLSSLSSTDYTALHHPRFPSHQVRIKKTDFCDPTVKYDSGGRRFWLSIELSAFQVFTQDI